MSNQETQIRLGIIKDTIDEQVRLCHFEDVVKELIFVVDIMNYLDKKYEEYALEIDRLSEAEAMDRK